MLQTGLLSDSIDISEGEEIPRLGILSANQGGGGSAREVNGTTRAALAVGDKELAVSNAQAGWLGPGGQ